MENDKKYITFDNVQVLSESPRALLVYIQGKECWIPKSQIHPASEVFEKGQHGCACVTKWIAEERQLQWGEDGDG